MSERDYEQGNRDLPFVVVLRAEDETNFFGFKTPSDRESFIDELRGREEVDWATTHDPEGAFLFAKALLESGDAKAIAAEIPALPEDLIHEYLGSLRGRTAANREKVLTTLNGVARQVRQAETRSRLDYVIGRLKGQLPSE